MASRVLTALAVLAAALAASTSAAYAQCGPPSTLERSLAQAEVVFVGRVVAVEDLNRQATMEVVEIWKGPDISGSVQVQGASSASQAVGPDDRTYVLGATYLVVPFGSSSPYYDDACSATMPYTPQGGQIPAQYRDAVGASAARLPAVTAPGETAAPPDGGLSLPIWIGGGAVVLLALWLATRRRKKASRATRDPEPAMPVAPPPQLEEPAEQPANEREPAGKPARRKTKPGKGKKSRRTAPAVKKARRARRTRAVPSPQTARPSRFGKSGLSNLETVRKKSRKIKRKQQKAKAK